jgi:hypothetical protein
MWHHLLRKPLLAVNLEGFASWHPGNDLFMTFSLCLFQQTMKLPRELKLELVILNFFFCFR